MIAKDCHCHRRSPISPMIPKKSSKIAKDCQRLPKIADDCQIAKDRQIAKNCQRSLKIAVITEDHRCQRLLKIAKDHLRLPNITEDHWRLTKIAEDRWRSMKEKTDSVRSSLPWKESTHTSKIIVFFVTFMVLWPFFYSLSKIVETNFLLT